MHPEVDDLFFGHFVYLAKRAAKKLRPMANGFLHTERCPPFRHRSFVQHATVVFEKSPALGQHFVFNHLVVGKTEVAALLENDADMSRWARMDHFVRHMIGEMLL